MGASSSTARSCRKTAPGSPEPGSALSPHWDIAPVALYVPNVTNVTGQGGGRCPSGSGGRGGRAVLVAVGGLLSLVLVATFATYARVDPAELYHVSESGLAGGLSRALMELNFPIALIAIPVALNAVDVLGTRSAAVAAAVAIASCAVVAWPGVVDQADLDARLVNAIPAAGVLLGVVLAVAAGRRLAWSAGPLRGDRARVVAALLIGIATIPYLFAELGLYAPDPVLADEPTPGEPIAAVHLGSHEGMDGALIALSMLALTRLVPWFVSRRLAVVTSALMALLLTYGVANLIQDDWLEQVVKRGWTDTRVPNVVHPQISVAWGVIAAAGIALEVLWFRRERERARYAAGRTMASTTARKS